MSERCIHCGCKVDSGYHEPTCPVRAKAAQQEPLPDAWLAVPGYEDPEREFLPILPGDWHFTIHDKEDVTTKLSIYYGNANPWVFAREIIVQLLDSAAQGNCLELEFKGQLQASLYTDAHFNVSPLLPSEVQVIKERIRARDAEELGTNK